MPFVIDKMNLGEMQSYLGGW